jgi:hypothetical protein
MDVTIQGAGPNENVEAQVDPSFGALRTSLRPLEFVSQSGVQGGHYGYAGKTGAATVIAAGGSIFSFRWADSARLAVIHKIFVGFTITTAFTTAQTIDAQLLVVRNFTASDTGGTTISARDARKRTTMPVSNVTDMRIATTAALGNGTGTADTNPVSVAVMATNSVNAIGSTSPMVPLLDIKAGAECSLILAQNEGFRISPLTTMGAAGVGNFYVYMDWAEVPSY